MLSRTKAWWLSNQLDFGLDEIKPPFWKIPVVRCRESSSDLLNKHGFSFYESGKCQGRIILVTVHALWIEREHGEITFPEEVLLLARAAPANPRNSTDDTVISHSRT